MHDVINRLVSAPKSNYMTYKFMSHVNSVTLSANDIQLQQDPKSQRMSHTVCTNNGDDSGEAKPT